MTTFSLFSSIPESWRVEWGECLRRICLCSSGEYIGHSFLPLSSWQQTGQIRGTTLAIYGGIYKIQGTTLTIYKGIYKIQGTTLTIYKGIYSIWGTTLAIYYKDCQRNQFGTFVLILFILKHLISILNMGPFEGIEFLPQTQIFLSLYLCNLMV